MNEIKIQVIGHCCTGKSTIKQIIFDALRANGFGHVEMEDRDGDQLKVKMSLEKRIAKISGQSNILIEEIHTAPRTRETKMN